MAFFFRSAPVVRRSLTLSFSVGVCVLGLSPFSFPSASLVSCGGLARAAALGLSRRAAILSLPTATRWLPSRRNYLYLTVCKLGAL